MKWNNLGLDHTRELGLNPTRGMLKVPSELISNRASSGFRGFRGRGDRRHSGPSGYSTDYHYQHTFNGNHSGSYNAGGGYRGRGKPLPGHGQPRWSASSSADRFNGQHSRGGFGRGGRPDGFRGRSFETRSRGPSSDNITHKFYGNCEVRPVRDAGAPAKPRGFYNGSTTSSGRRLS